MPRSPLPPLFLNPNVMSDPNIASLSATVAALDPFGSSGGLSDDVLSHIFHYLDVTNLNNSARVCSQWHQVLWPTLRHLEFADSTSVNLSVLERFSDRCQGLTALTLIRCLSVRDDCAAAMLQMRHLRYLNISYCDWITDKLIVGLKDHPSLIELRLVASCRVTLSTASMAPPKLTILSLSACRGLDSDSLPVISRIHNLNTLDLSFASPALLANEQVNFLVALQSLTSLNLNGSSAVDAVLHVLGELPRLEHLDLTYNTKLTAAGVAQLAKLASLRYLSLARCAGLADIALFSLARLSSLEYLDISFTGMSEDSLESLSSLTKLKTLKASKHNPGPAFLTSLLRNGSITDLSLIDCTFDPTDFYLFKGFTQLRRLDLQGSRGISDPFFANIANLHKLDYLSMSSNYDITCQGISVLKSLPVLSTLVLDWCANVTDSIGSRISAFPSLTHLSLRSCHNLTDACLAGLTILPKIDTFDVSHCAGIKGARALAAKPQEGRTINIIV